MLTSSRRNFLAAGAALPTAGAVAAVPAGAQDQVAADLARYIGFGSKQAGGPGDTASGEWLAGELDRLGFTVERNRFNAPFFDTTRADLHCGDATAKVWPQPIVVPTGGAGVTGPLVRIDPMGIPAGPLAGAIALLDLPYQRWSTATARPIREPVTAAFAAGAKGAVIITNGPTGKIIALNADGREPMFKGPVALLAPEDARPFLAASATHSTATLILDGVGGRRPAFNLVGRIDRKRPRWLVVSTPRSGWFTCAGERGGGIAGWLWLARWASKAVRTHNLAFVCNSGHEYEYLGAAEALKAFTPKPAATDFWLHLGANVASSDWHEWPGQWKPLPSIDSQRYLSISPALLPHARAAFAGQVGYEAPYGSDTLSAGELTEIIAAGYKPAAGVFGIHRFHHVAQDDARCVSAASVAKTAAAFQNFVERVLRG